MWAILNRALESRHYIFCYKICHQKRKYLGPYSEFQIYQKYSISKEGSFWFCLTLDMDVEQTESISLIEPSNIH